VVLPLRAALAENAFRPVDAEKAAASRRTPKIFGPTLVKLFGRV
jgi:hypothetical protein